MNERLEHEHALDMLEFVLDKYLIDYTSVAAKYDLLKLLENKFSRYDDKNYYGGAGKRLKEFMIGAYNGRM